jgi:hypothetical protein
VGHAEQQQIGLKSGAIRSADPGMLLSCRAAKIEPAGRPVHWPPGQRQGSRPHEKDIDQIALDNRAQGLRVSFSF